MKNIELRTQLYNKIETLREQMHRSSVTAAENINSQETHRISQKLDKLILEVMKYYLN